MLVYREVGGAGREFEVVQWATYDQPCLVQWRGPHVGQPFKPWGYNFHDAHAMDAYIKEHAFPWTRRHCPRRTGS